MSQVHFDFAASRALPGAAAERACGKRERAALRSIVAGAVMVALLLAGMLLRLWAYLPAAAHISG